MISANTKLFSKIDTYCEKRLSKSLITTKAGRYIATNEDEKEKLKNLKEEVKLEFSNKKLLLQCSIVDDLYIACIGFNNLDCLKYHSNEDTCAGFTTFLLSEYEITPQSKFDDISNIIDIGHMDEAGYSGHDHKQVLSLYDSIKIYKLANLDHQNTFWFFLKACLEENRNSNSWIDDQLIEEFEVLMDLDPNDVPLDTVCRSIFDVDHSSLFLSLYRCLENIYAMKQCNSLKDDLAITALEWREIAIKLEEKISWRPNELKSLIELLKLCSDIDHKELLESTNTRIDDRMNLSKVAAKKIYEIRNSHVHFRPIHQNTMEYKWTSICKIMIRYIYYTYSQNY